MYAILVDLKIFVIFMLKGLASLFGMSAIIEDEEDGQPRMIEDDEDDEEEEEKLNIEADELPPKPSKSVAKTLDSKKTIIGKAKKERKPRALRAPIIKRVVRVSAAKPVPYNIQDKGTECIRRTKTATFATREGKLIVTVKKGRGTKDYQYDLVACRQNLPVLIKAEMEKNQVFTLDATRLAVHFPGLYWNAAHLLQGSLAKIDQMLQEAGVPTGQRREK